MRLITSSRTSVWFTLAERAAGKPQSMKTEQPEQMLLLTQD